MSGNNWFTYEPKFLEHKFGEEVSSPPQTVSVPVYLIPAYTDVEIVINSTGRINLPKLQPNGIHTPEVVFTEENLYYYEKDLNIYVYVFRKKNSAELSSVLSLDEVHRIPETIRKTCIETIPDDMFTLAGELYEGNDAITAIETFYNFVHKHLSFVHKHSREERTRGKELDKLLKEYRAAGYFSGNCREGRSFFAGLCYAKGLPVRKVLGKIPYHDLSFHVWNDVCVPTGDGYEWVPVDATKGFFNRLSRKHFFRSQIHMSIRSAITNKFLGKPNEFTLKVDSLS